MKDKVNEFLNIPERLIIGFRKGYDTFTGLLSYVTYYRGGKIAKEVSWSSWRDKSIDPQEIDNTPVEGFFINKKVGGSRSGWNYRQPYCRIYDPRGFEFEITFDNLIYILQNCSYDSEKGLIGKFVYAWDSAQLVLLPINSEDYTASRKLKEDADKANIKAKDLIPGKAYKTKKFDVAYYLGNLKWRIQYTNKTTGAKEIKFPEYHTFLVKGGSCVIEDTAIGINTMSNILVAKDDITSLDAIETKYYIEKFKNSIYGNTGVATELRIHETSSTTLQKDWEDIIVKRQREGSIFGAVLNSSNHLTIYGFRLAAKCIFDYHKLTYTKTSEFVLERGRKEDIIIDPKTGIINEIIDRKTSLINDDEINELVPINYNYRDYNWEAKVGNIWYNGNYYINGATKPECHI